MGILVLFFWPLGTVHLPLVDLLTKGLPALAYWGHVEKLGPKEVREGWVFEIWEWRRHRFSLKEFS